MRQLSKATKRWIDVIGFAFAILALIAVAAVVIFWWSQPWPGWP
jgi:hypothetical protein